MWDSKVDKGRETRRLFNLATDLGRLGELLTRLTEVALVVIDPVSAYLGGTDSHRNAEGHAAAIVCVSHLAKASEDWHPRRCAPRRRPPSCPSAKSASAGYSSMRTLPSGSRSPMLFGGRRCRATGGNINVALQT